MRSQVYLNGSFDPESGVVREVWSDTKKYKKGDISREGLSLRTILTAGSFMETEGVLNKLVVHNKTFANLYAQAEKLLSVVQN